MIIFLFGTWGSGKSFVGNMIHERCGILHIEADLHFNKKMLAALHQRKFHELEMEAYYDRVISDIFGYQRRSRDFIVSQAIYYEYYRQMIFNCFSPDIHFAWVKTEDEYLQKSRLRERATTGNPVTPEVYEYMKQYWEEPTLPHEILINDYTLEGQVKTFLDSLGLCVQWEKSSRLARLGV